MNYEQQSQKLTLWDRQTSVLHPFNIVYNTDKCVFQSYLGMEITTFNEVIHQSKQLSKPQNLHKPAIQLQEL